MRSLEAEGVKTIFGYPGGAIMPVFDALYDYTRGEKKAFNHILVRHEQAAAHAAEGFARVSGEVGVCLVTSGPGVTNTLTGVADAMMDSTPIVVIAGQVGVGALGTDAFQEVDLVGLSQPITKWSYQIRRPEDVAWAVSRAFYIARSGRPGPVVLDFPKNAQIHSCNWNPVQVTSIRSYNPYPKISQTAVEQAAELINAAERPLALVGQGVELGGAQNELVEFLERADIPAARTLLGLSALPSNHPLNMGMLGMHGNYAPNVMENKCDVLIAIGMRFSDRVTGRLDTYAKQAKIIHLDIEENDKVIQPAIHPAEGPLLMGEVANVVAEVTKGEAIVVTDVGQNQMFSCRYSKFNLKRSIVTSGGLGTMGFGLPAAVGATFGAPDRTVCLFTGDGGFQMSIQELGTIMEQQTPVKVVLLNNNYLGNVRQWQDMFFNHRQSFTKMLNPHYATICKGYAIPYDVVTDRSKLRAAVEKMIATPGPYVLELAIKEEDNVLPMTPPGNSVDDMLLEIKA